MIEPASDHAATVTNLPQLGVSFPGREDKVHRFPLEWNRWERLEIALPDRWKGEGVLLALEGGVVDVSGIRIVSAVMGETVWELAGKDLFSAVQVSGGAKNEPHPRLLRLRCAVGDAPKILLPRVDLRSCDEPLRLEIGIRVHGETSVTEGLSHALPEPPAPVENGRHPSGSAQDEAMRDGGPFRLVANTQMAERSVPSETGHILAVRAEAERHVIALRTQLWEANEKSAALSAQLDAARDVARRQASAWREEVKNARAHADERAATLLAEVEKARAHGDERAEVLMRELEKVRSDFRAAVEEKRVFHDALTSDWQLLKDLDAELWAMLQGLHSQLDAQRSQVLDAEAELHELREEKARWQQDETFLRQEIAGMQQELQGLDEAAVSTTRRLAETQAALDALRRRAEDDDGRLRSMRGSASWKMTLPLRAVHRLATGQKSGRRNGAAPVEQARALGNGEPQAAGTGGYRFHLDEPTNWDLPTQRVRLRGWFLPPADGRDGMPTLRVRCGDRVTVVPCDLPRPDVLTAVGGNMEWRLCGFDANIDFAGGPSEVLVEAVESGGRVWPMARYRVRAPYAAWKGPEGPGGAAAGADPAHDYAAWVERFERLSVAERRALRARARGLAYRPLISVVMPVYNPPEAWLVRAIESVRGQLYPFWELCVADDASPGGHVRAVLERYARQDARIKVAYRGQNGHISAASNTALGLAGGEFVALLDHDDELPPHALLTVAMELQEHPEADLIYSDEDKIDEEGKRFSPYFKPDWNPDLLLGQNFVSHLGVYRREVIEQVGGFRVGYEGCQDWDLVLRVTEQIPAARIRHIPRVLYHWRAIEGSTARAVEEKDYVVEASRRVLRDHCERTGKNTAILPIPGGHFRVQYLLPEPPPLVSIIIPTHNQLGLLRHGIESLRTRTTYPNYEIVVVDNRSDDAATLAYLDELDRSGDARVLRYAQPFNYSAINNFAVQEAGGELVALLNNDMEVITPGWLEEMASHALRPDIGAVGAILYYPDDSIQHAGVVLGIGGVAGHIFSRMPRGTDGYFNRARLVQNFSAVTAACLVIRRSTYQQVGGLNETLKVAFNDVDFCLKARAAGFNNLWTPFAEFYHHESASRGAEDTTDKYRRFVSEVEYMREHWEPLIEADPAYNVNLTTEGGRCLLANPPRVPLLRTLAVQAQDPAHAPAGA